LLEESVWGAAQSLWLPKQKKDAGDGLDETRVGFLLFVFCVVFVFCFFALLIS